MERKKRERKRKRERDRERDIKTGEQGSAVNEDRMT